LVANHLVARVDGVSFLSGASISAASKLAPSASPPRSRCAEPSCFNRVLSPELSADAAPLPRHPVECVIPAAKLQAWVLTEAGLAAKG
jgi:hypothetical protein